MKSMSSIIYIILLVLVIYVLQQAPSSSSARLYDNKNDGDTLLALKASLGNQSGALASWNKTTDFCRWEGVSCKWHRVIALDLSWEGLVGTIAPSIGNLTFLETLDLKCNNLHGEIPSTIGRLSQLRYIDLYNNSFQGEINANLKNCTSLHSINLDTNNLTGEIPAWLGGLLSLTAIHLQKNSFTGIIPPSLGNLSALREIYISWNPLGGHIPEGLGRCSRLEYVQLTGNHLSGTIPSTLLNLSSITHFSVAMNDLHGNLPLDLGNRLFKLQYLLLGVNQFTGGLPTSLANATDMHVLDLSHNNFTGSLPPEIGRLCPHVICLGYNQLVATTAQDWDFITFMTNCTRLRLLILENNMLGGMLPNSVTNLTDRLQVLDIRFNEISGKIPFGISNLIGLNTLQLNNNRFTGILPDSIGRLHSLKLLEFNNNLLRGLIPTSLGNMTQLQRLNTNNNMFEGSLPASLGSLQQITEASFSNNNFTGSLPMDIFNLSSLSYYLDLSKNYFIGLLPPEVGGLTQLAYLDISSNILSGPLPPELSNCQNLIKLKLGSNSFSGSIPTSISKIEGLILLNLTKNSLSGTVPQELGEIRGLEELYISHNNLSGHIPERFENMTSLYKLDLSFNHLVGEVPLHGVFNNVTGFSFDGNLGLCGGIPELNLPPCLPKSMEHDKRKLCLVLKVMLPAAAIVLCFSSVLFFMSLRKKQQHNTTTLVGAHLMDDKYPRVSYAELLQGTDGFSTDNLLGTGRYGSVYKCSLLLKNSITTVAVKVFDLKQSGSSRSFITECEALNKIRHRNLISIITCCSSADSNQHDFKAVVFEFMPNGSLHSWLYIDVDASPQRQGLTMMQRLNIAVDVADALDYLHNNCEPPIVHCDLKPSNILLNQDLVAHIGDFGLAKIISNSASEQLMNSKSTVGLRGTIGYVAPEYGEGIQVSPCGDVYSFGIVILELFTGMAPTDDMFSGGLTLQKHVENAFPGMIMNIIDPVLLSDEQTYASNLQCGRNSMEDISKVMLSITNLALSCSKQAPIERMCMRDVATEMHRTRDYYVKSRYKRS